MDVLSVGPFGRAGSRCAWNRQGALSALDWLVMLGTVLSIAAYGAWKTRNVQSAAGYLRGEDQRWPTIGLAIMATQASAITFLSVPGQAYEDGMGFAQFYFGLPLAMVVISAFFVPIYYRLNVMTAYEFLEKRFDARVRALAAGLFLIGRGLAAGVSLYAPAIVLTAVLGWPTRGTAALMGLLVIAYTVTGGAQAVSQTQRQQMAVILAGLFIAAGIVAGKLPDAVGVSGAVAVAGAVGRMELIDLTFDPNTRYTLWSGLTGGFFLSLSYFGTDHSQVQRYLGGRSVAESRLGLLFNGLLKIPMQVLILFVGVLLFAFHVFVRPPLHFNGPDLAATQRAFPAEVAALDRRWDSAFEARKSVAETVAAGDPDARDRFRASQAEMDAIKADTRALVARAVPGAKVKDADHVFLSFVLTNMPVGTVGLLVAVILMAAMSSTASELSSLGSTSVVDFWVRWVRPAAGSAEMVRAGRIFTVGWGLVAIGFAAFASVVDNLIEAVNILGSIFYGVILGIFLVALFLPRIGATPVFAGALVAQLAVIGLFFASDIGFLWFNLIGCSLVVVLAALVQVVGGGPVNSMESAT